MAAIKLRRCPFCGAEAAIISKSDNFRIVGCPTTSMLCPNPRMVVYPNGSGEYNYSYWNTRYEDARLSFTEAWDEAHGDRK